MLVLISYNSALSPHLSTGELMICCTGRMTGSSGRLGLLLRPHESIVGAPESGNAGFVDGVADVDAVVVPLARDGGDCEAWERMNAVTWV